MSDGSALPGRIKISEKDTDQTAFKYPEVDSDEGIEDDEVYRFLTAQFTVNPPSKILGGRVWVPEKFTARGPKKIITIFVYDANLKKVIKAEYNYNKQKRIMEAK